VSKLSDTQIERYSRQIILPQVGGKGQEKLLRAKVLVNGSGVLQSSALYYLAAAGVGTIGILASAPLPIFSPLGEDQEEAARIVLNGLNPDCTITTHHAEDALQSEKLVERYDLILSPADPLHEVCYRMRKPFLCTHVSGDQAWFFASTGYMTEHPCLRCLPPWLFIPEKSSFPFEEIAKFFLGTVQTTEAIKFLLGLHTTPHTKLLRVQFPSLVFTEEVMPKDPACSVCGSLPA
jgi:adenylyltransferase/sulfurtransferase